MDQILASELAPFLSLSIEAWQNLPACYLLEGEDRSQFADSETHATKQLLAMYSQAATRQFPGLIRDPFDEESLSGNHSAIQCRR